MQYACDAYAMRCARNVMDADEDGDGVRGYKYTITTKNGGLAQ